SRHPGTPAACAARCAHRAGRSGVGSVPTAGDAAAAVAGAPAAAGTRSAVAAGRDAAVAGQPAVSAAGLAGGRQQLMSTIFNVRNLRIPNVSRVSVTVGTIVVVLAILAALGGWQLYRRLTTNTVVAYFAQTLALYPGDKVQIMGVQVGKIDEIEP